MKKLTADQLLEAAELLRRGQLVAFPTETVYGLGASIFLENGIQAIFKAKGRPSDNPLIAHVSSVEQVEQIAIAIPKAFYLLARAFFPGPLAIVLKKHPSVPSSVSAGLETIAVRIPAHPIAQKLISLVGTPLVAPSANLSGKPSATCVEHVLEDFGESIAAVVDGGPTEIGIESTVVSLLSETPVLLRPGIITKEEIEAVLGTSIACSHPHSQGPALSPGMKYRHYCPQTPIRLFYTLQDLHGYLEGCKDEKRRMVLSVDPLPDQKEHFMLSAKELYALLRLADKQGYGEIVILCDEKVQQQSGLMNRILRATSK